MGKGKFGWHNGTVNVSRISRQGIVVISAGSAAKVDCDKGSIFTLTPTEAETLTVSGGKPGQEIYIKVLTSGTNSFNVTFSTGFLATAVLATGTVSAKTFVLHFVNVAGTFVEVARTAAM
jgi:hypothetical protein